MKGDTQLEPGVCRMSFNIKDTRMFLLTFDRSVRCVVIRTAAIAESEEG
jgi:hypothetical protein